MKMQISKPMFLAGAVSITALVMDFFLHSQEADMQGQRFGAREYAALMQARYDGFMGARVPVIEAPDDIDVRDIRYTSSGEEGAAPAEEGPAPRRRAFQGGQSECYNDGSFKTCRIVTK